MAKRKAEYDGITPDLRNANRGTERGRYMVEASLRETGAGRSIVLDKDGRIIAGNKTFEAASDIGLPVRIVQTDGTELVAVQRTDLDLSDDTGAARKLAYYDNRAGQVGLEWDASVLLGDLTAGLDLSAMFRQDELDELLADLTPKPTGDTEPQTDRAEELRQIWNVQPGQLWQLGEHRLICGDCTDAATVARVMGGERAQAVVTSPPYPGADMWDDMGAVAEVERVGLDALRLCVPIVGDGCPILWNVANTPIGTQAGVVHTTTTTKVAADELGLLCYGEIIWSKPCQHLTPISFMMRPVVPNLVHEYVMIFYNGKRKQRENTSGLSDEDKAIRTKSVWDLATESATEVNHKAPFPLELARRCVALWTLEGDTVYEPFSGSGTTIIACENLSRRCRAVEVSPAYVAVALQRWADHTQRTPVLLEA